MRLSRIVQQASEAKAPIPAPSPVHVALVGLFGQLIQAGHNHPMAKLGARLVPSMLRDVAEIPEPMLAKWCLEMGLALQSVARASGPDPQVPDVVEAMERAFSDDQPELETHGHADAIEAGSIEPVPDQPSLPAG